MAPLSTNAVAHFLHPAHKLTELNNDTPYLCDGCKIAGNGTQFSCVSCQFDLHVYCAKGPHVLTSTTNHPHTMNLVDYRSNPYQTEPCQICRVPIQGLVYVCKSCNFLVHPPCVSCNSGLNHVHSALPSSGLTTPITPSGSTSRGGSTSPGGSTSHGGSTSQRIGEQVGVGLAINYTYDTVEEAGNGDFIEGIASVIKNIFSS